MILAAGLGTRLYPLTKNIPKCMINIGGRPLIEHQINWLRDNNITEIAINLHHLPEKIKEYLGDGSRLGVKLIYSFEDKLLGTAGGVKKVEEFFDGLFVVFYGDEYTNLDLNKLKAYHNLKKAFLTVCIREKPMGSRVSDLIVLDKNNKITEFIEKPSEEQVKGMNIPNMANCGIYLCNQELLKELPKNKFLDFCDDIFPTLVKRKEIYGFTMPDNCYWYELGRLEKYKKFKPEIEKKLKLNNQ